MIKIVESKVSFNNKVWEGISSEAKNLLKNMLRLNTRKRFNAKKWLKHEWFQIVIKTTENDHQNSLDVGTLQRLVNFIAASSLQLLALNALIKYVKLEDIQDLKQQFEAMDEDKNGKLSAKELYNALQIAELNIPKDKIQEIIYEIDHNENQEVNYTEFIAATIDTKAVINENKVYMLFKELDQDDDGFISVENIKSIFSKHNKTLSKVELKRILAEHDQSRDGKISYEEFRPILLSSTTLTSSRLSSFHK